MHTLARPATCHRVSFTAPLAVLSPGPKLAGTPSRGRKVMNRRIEIRTPNRGASHRWVDFACLQASSGPLTKSGDVGWPLSVIAPETSESAIRRDAGPGGRER